MNEPHEFQAPTPPFPAAAEDALPTSLDPAASAPRKQSLTWLWMTLSVVGALTILAVVGGIAVSRANSHTFSPGYSAEPISADDAEQQGVVVAQSGEVSYEIGEGWVDVRDFVGPLPSDDDDPLVGRELLGLYYTKDPMLPGAQVVMVFALSPAALTVNDLEAVMAGYLYEATWETDDSTIGPISPYSSALSLQGYEAGYQAEAMGFDTDAHVVVVGHRRQVVVVHLTAIDDVADPTLIYPLLDTLRIE